MSSFQTNKKMKKYGDFITRTPKQDDFTEYVFTDAKGNKVTILRTELCKEVDEYLYESLKCEANSNRKEIESHRAITYSGEKNDQLLNMQQSNDDVEGLVYQNYVSEEINKAIESLKPKQQMVAKKKLYEMKSNTEIAKELGVTEGAVRSQYETVKKLLSEKLKHLKE